MKAKGQVHSWRDKVAIKVEAQLSFVGVTYVLSCAIAFNSPLLAVFIPESVGLAILALPQVCCTPRFFLVHHSVDTFYYGSELF